MTIAPDCWVEMNGTRFADTGDDLVAGTPTALSQLKVTWGRATTVDQPEPATCRFNVRDRSGGAGFLEVLDVGAAIDVWSSGDIGTGSPTETVVDGGFETSPLGPAGNRASVYNGIGTATIVASPVYVGARALDLAHGEPVFNASVVFRVPPAAFTPGDPAGWDAIPRFAFGSIWTMTVAVRIGVGMRVQVGGVGLMSPEDADSWPGTIGWRLFVGTGTWTVETFELRNNLWDEPDVWAALQVNVNRIGMWTDVAGTWADTPGTWAEARSVTVDDLSITAPPGGLIRDVLVFSGRVTDLTAELLDIAGTLGVEVTAVDQLADLQNRYVGDTPWPSQTVAARFAAIIAASAADVDTRLDTPLDALMVSRRDVDNQPTGGLLQEIAAGVDGVLWSATHQTTGPYLWLENVANRTAVATLALQGGVVVIVPPSTGQRPPGRTDLDGCDLPDTNVQWRRDVTDVVTRVDATWLDQTTTPDPTERTVRVVDAPAETVYGVRRFGVTTPLVNATDATNVANRILARTRYDEWRVEGLEYDLRIAPPAAGAEMAAALDLLDGTIRLGRAVTVFDVTRWPGGDVIGMFLEGGVYQFDSGWTMGLVGSPYAGVGESGGWSTMDPAWRWNQMAPDIAWVDCWGVTGPITKEAA